MTADNTPAVRAPRRDPVPATYNEAMTVGATLAKSGFFKDARQAEQAAAKVIAGMELGLGPMASMTGIHVIDGKIALGANLIAGQIKRSGRYDYRVTQLDDTGCVIEFFEGGKPAGVSSFTRDDAKRAGLSGANYTKYPRNMFFSRAISNGARWYCADVFAGPVYTPDELGATVDGETGEVIDLPAPAVEAGPSDEEALAKERARSLMDAGPEAAVVAAMKEAGIRSAELHDDDTFYRAQAVVVAAVEAADAPVEAPAEEAA